MNANTTALQNMLSPCILCPRECRVDRLKNEPGFCQIGRDAVVASWGPHFGEERVLVGGGGSGTLFFSGCNLGCVFCQNWEISHQVSGQKMKSQQLSSLMLRLQQQGCHNINFVTPTHVAPMIAEGIELARADGLQVPTVYNCGGYEKTEALQKLEGLIDIYMPDFKYMDPASSARFLQAENYPAIAMEAIKEMQRQVGELQLENGLATRGLLVRHLVMPGATDDSLAILDFLAEEISPNTYLNVMDQYQPSYHAFHYPEINRMIYAEEYAKVREYAQSKGFRLAE